MIRILSQPVYSIWFVTIHSFWLWGFTCYDVYQQANNAERKIVAHTGLEQATSGLQSKHVPNWATSGDM